MIQLTVSILVGLMAGFAFQNIGIGIVAMLVAAVLMDLFKEEK